jgi:hypothetical protein
LVFFHRSFQFLYISIGRIFAGGGFLCCR